MLDYFATPTTQLGSLGWLFFSAQVLGLLAGVYMLFIQPSRHPVYSQPLQRIGYALLALGAVGILLGIARLANLGPLTYRWWFYLLALVEIGVGAYLFYHWQSVIPAKLEAYRASFKRGARPVQRAGAARAFKTPQSANGTAAESPQPKPTPTTSRRDARRDRKRRK